MPECEPFEPLTSPSLTIFGPGSSNRVFLTMNVGTTYPLFDTLPGESLTGDPGDILLIIKRDPLCMFFYSEHEG